MKRFTCTVHVHLFFRVSTIVECVEGSGANLTIKDQKQLSCRETCDLYCLNINGVYML